MKIFTRSFKDFLQTSELDVYDVMEHKGNWRSAMSRYSKRNHSMLLLIRLAVNDDEKEKWVNEKIKLIEWYKTIKEKCEITSFYIQMYL